MRRLPEPDEGPGRGLSWPEGRALTRAKNPEWPPGRRGGPAALCLSLRSATAASAGGASPGPGQDETHRGVCVITQLLLLLRSVGEEDEKAAETRVQANGVDAGEDTEC